MVIGWAVDRSTCAILVIVLMILEESWSETVYMDRYGDCFHEGPMEVEDESFTIQSQGGDAYDTLYCEMTFKSTKDDRLCLSFTRFSISNCAVKLSAFSEKSSSGVALGTYSCHIGDTPEMVCSEGKYLTVLMRKQELSHDGYDFTLELRDYSQHGIDAYIVSISVIVGIIVGVIVIVLLTAVIIVCCCCNNRQFSMSYKHKSSASTRTGYTDVPVQPSAPRLPTEDPPAYAEDPPPYTSSDSQHNTTEDKAFV